MGSGSDTLKHRTDEVQKRRKEKLKKVLGDDIPDRFEVEDKEEIDDN